MSHWYPLWYPPTPTALKGGAAAVAKAEATAGHFERMLWKHTLGIILNVLVIGGLLIWLFHLAYGKVEPPTVSGLHRRIGYCGRVHPPTDIIGYTDVWRGRT